MKRTSYLLRDALDGRTDGRTDTRDAQTHGTHARTAPQKRHDSNASLLFYYEPNFPLPSYSSTFFVGISTGFSDIFLCTYLYHLAEC